MDNFDSRFDKHFDRHFDNMEKMMDNPVKTFAKFGLVAIVINLVFALIIIAAIIFGLSLVF